MIEVQDFIQSFRGLNVPAELLNLLDFQNNISKASAYAAEFELTAPKDKAGLMSYSDNPDFLDALIEFANADGMGSFYAFWRRENIQDLQQAPIVIFGGEGGFHVVARNILDFFQILAFDTEPMVSWEEVYYFKDEHDFEPSEKSENFKNWLQNFGINEIPEADDIVAIAQEAYQEEFKAWIQKYYAG